jgi:hypothetical protein
MSVSIWPRLREQRLAKEAETVRTEIATGNQPQRPNQKAIQVEDRLSWWPQEAEISRPEAIRRLVEILMQSGGNRKQS